MSLIKRLPAALVFALTAPLVTGCEGPTSPVNPGGAEVAFGAPTWHPIEARAAVTSTVQGRIVVGGHIPTGNPCQDLRGGAMLTRGTLEFFITARQRDSLCPAVIAVHPYVAARDGLAPGSYRVRVHHMYENTGWENTVVLDSTVVVQ